MKIDFTTTEIQVLRDLIGNLSNTTAEDFASRHMDFDERERFVGAIKGDTDLLYHIYKKLPELEPVKKYRYAYALNTDGVDKVQISEGYYATEQEFLECIFRGRSQFAFIQRCDELVIEEFGILQSN